MRVERDTKFTIEEAVYCRDFGEFAWHEGRVVAIPAKRWWHRRQRYLIDVPTNIVDGGTILYTKHDMDIYSEKHILKEN